MSSDGSQDGGEPQRNNNINDEGNIINDTVADPSSSVDLSTTQIEQNNVDDNSMEVRIKNVMVGMGVNPTQHQSSAVQQLERLFPPSTIGGSNGNLLSSTKPSAAGGGTLSTTNGHGAAPLSQQPSAQDLSLLSLLNNFLTPSDLAMAMNDPNFLMPTPFAPGQNAYTLQQQQRAAAKSGGGVPTVVAPPASVNTGGGVVVPNNVSSLFGGATGGANNNNALQFPQYMLQQQQTQQALSQQALLQQLGLGGAVSAPTMPAAASAYGFPSMVPMNPADINFLLAAGAATGGYPGAAAAAAAAASLNPHLMSAAAMMGNPTGMVTGLGPAQFGSGYPNNMFNNPSTTAAAASAMNPMAQYAATMASNMPQQMVTMDQSSVKMMPSHRGIGNDGTGIGSDSEPMIKSREARWIIRYNELLQVNRYTRVFNNFVCSLASTLLDLTHSFLILVFYTFFLSFEWIMDIVVSRMAIPRIVNYLGGL